ncbi:MAG: hypothetical protein HKN21_03200, partial [Candidatus Eisenbacteria bacterium]|nr:hypothetical protein [Candidatus Eisenbacteria bacterium]
MKSRSLLFILLGMLLAQVALFALYYGNHDRALVDDAFISFRYAERFGDGLGLTFNDGEAVEGFSNPLWTLLLGVLSATGIAPHQIAPILSLVFLLGSLLVLYRFCRRAPWGLPAKALLMGVLAVDGGVLLWSGSGLETPLVVFLVCLWLTAAWPVGMDRSRGRALWLGCLTGLLLLARPEAVLWLVPMGAWLLWGLWLPVRFLLTAFASAVVLPAMYLVFRWVTYGALLPNTFFAKVEPGSQGWLQGLENLGWWCLSHAALAFLVLLTWSRHPFGKSALGPPWFRLFLVGWLLMQAAFVFAVGGDWMGHTRYLAVVIPVLAFLVAWQWEQRFSVLREGRGLAVVLLFLVIHAGVG